MLDQIDDKLRRWVRSLLGEAAVSLGPPRRSESEAGSEALAGVEVSLYLMDLSHRPAPRTTRRPPLSLTLRYLVTTWADAPAAAHRAIGVLAFEAMKAAEFEVEPDPLPASAWVAFGVPPRPSFILRVPAQQPWDEKLAPPVREVQTDVSPLRVVRGTVVGVGGRPVAGAEVEFPAVGLSGRTDGAGRFVFAVPAGQDVRLRARYRDREAAFPPDAAVVGGTGAARGRLADGRLADGRPADDGPLVVRVEGLED